MAKAKRFDMLNGALLPKILMFSLPLALTGILQLLFNAADVIVVGKFAGSTSLAADDSWDSERDAPRAAASSVLRTAGPPTPWPLCSARARVTRTI